MKPSRVGKIASGVALLGIALGSAALTLGRAQGVAWVGKPLDVQIQMQAYSVEDLQPGCLAADVLYGDTELDPARVSVNAAPAAGAVQTVRIVATVPVDEPIVTLRLRVGCNQKLSKRYIFFAELPTNVVEPVARGDLVAQSAQRAALAEQVPLRAVTGIAMPRVKSPTPSKSALEPMPAPTPKAVPPAIRPNNTKAPGKPRLKLDSLDLLIERDPVLRSTDELLALPQEDGAKRAEAAALWRSMNVSPEQLIQDEAKAQALERDIKSLHAVTLQNQKGLIDLVAKVQQTESERYSNGLVYSLMGLWMAGLVALLWFWRRNRVERPSDWRYGHDAQDSLLAEIVERPPGERSAPSAGSATPAVAAPPVVVPAPLTEVDLDFDLDLMEPPSRDAVQSASQRTQAVEARSDSHRDFSVSVPSGIRSFDSEELVDVREQAEFFMSLGQHDKAIDILTTRVAQFGESSPLVCLDLLKVYHALGREADFEFMRTEFNHWFAAHVPEFPFFGDQGRALEQYPQIVESIVALWPTPAVLEFIEGCLYHHADDGVGGGVVFDLQAYLDLLFLHGVAKQLVRQPGSSEAGPVSEALRIPARAHGNPAGDASQSPGGPVVAHRAGAQHRGSPLGVMKSPPTTPAAESATDQKTPTDSGPDGNHTDFNFVGLR